MRARPNITRERLLDALEQAGGQRKRAAELLGVGRATLYRWMARHGLSGETGRLVSDRYEIVRELGAGRQGRVLLVRDRLHGVEERALKLLHDVGLSADLSRLRDEYRTFSRLRHPGLVRVYDFGLDDRTRQPYLVMECVQGRPFGDAARGVRVRAVLERFGKVLEAVGHLHSHGLVHRDLKSENVLVCRTEEPGSDGEVRVLDLGLSEPLAGPELPAGGTLLYCAPEVLDGARASARSDLYALGVMLYIALCGRPPFPGEEVHETIEAHRRGRYGKPSEVRRELPPRLDRFVARLLEPDPARRLTDCASAREELAGVLHPDAGGGARGPRRRFSGTTELIGRDEEIDALCGRMEDADAGPTGVLLEGEAGIGKSRVLEALADELRARGWRVASATCRADTLAAARPLADLVAAALGGASGDGTGPMDALVRRHAPALARLDGERWGAIPQARRQSDTAGLGRAQLLEEVSAVLRGVGEAQPLALLLDDLHEAEPLILDGLRLITGQAPGESVRLVAGSRPRREMLADLEAAGTWEHHRLGPLRPDAVTELATRTLGAAKGSLLGERLHSVTGGHPLYLQSVLRELAEAPDEEQAARLTERLPPSLAQALGTRIERAGRDSRAFMSALAVRKGASRADELEAVTGVSSGEALAELEGLGLVEARGRDAVEFTHALIREVVLARTGRGTLDRWHSAWAERLAGDPERVVERAGHLLESGAGADARDVYLAAADELERTWRHGRALGFLRAALELLEAGDPDRLPLYERLERAYRIVRDEQGAVAVCAAWAELAHRLGRCAAEARALAMKASWHREAAEMQAGLDAADRAVARAEQAGDPAVLGESLKVRATLRWISWQREAARGDFERAVSCVRRSGDPARIGFCLADVAVPRAQRGDLSGAFAAFDEAFEHLADPSLELWALLARTIRGYMLGYVGDLESGIREIESAIGDLRRLRAPVALTEPLENLALFQLRTGRFEPALETAGALVQEGIRFARPGHRISGLLAMGEACLQLDAREAARDHDRLALELSERLGQRGQLQFARLAVARDHRLDQRYGPATELASLAYEEARSRGNPRQWGRAALEMARCLRELGRCDDARHWLERALSALSISWEDSPALRAGCLSESATAHAASGRPGLAAADLYEALGLARRAGPVSLELELWLKLAEAESARGGDGEAEMALTEASRLVEKLALGIHSGEHRARFLARPDFEPTRRSGRLARDVERPGAESHELTALYEVSRAIAGHGDRGPLFDRVVEVTLERVGGERAALVLRDEASGRLIVAASNGLESETQREVSRLSRSVLERADHGEPVWASDTSVSPDLAQAKSVAMFGIRSVMCVPLRIGSEILGTLYVDSRDERAGFDGSSLRFLEAVADQVALALAYSRLMQDLTRERDALRESLADVEAFEGMVGRSAPMRSVFELVERVAPTTLPVIVTGESGTGKELVARAIHRRSARSDAPFLSENCAAIPEGLLESTLFGHVRGAFTGADRDAPGLFERASGGTLLLDEVGDMSPGLQAKLLRVLQEGELRRVGGAEPVAVDVRIIAATHRDLEELIRQGRFRQDLYFRLNGITLGLPPLRRRREDVPSLVRHFLEVEAAAARRPVPKLEPSVWRALLAHDWPGNVRELHNAVRRLLLLAGERWIGAETLEADPELGPLARWSPAASAESGGSRRTGSGVDRTQIEQALIRTGGNRKEAAALLGISRATLYRKLHSRAGSD